MRAPAHPMPDLTGVLWRGYRLGGARQRRFLRTREQHHPTRHTSSEPAAQVRAEGGRGAVLTTLAALAENGCRDVNHGWIGAAGPFQQAIDDAALAGKANLALGEAVRARHCARTPQAPDCSDGQIARSSIGAL